MKGSALTSAKRLLRFLPDRAYIQLYYFAKFRRLPDLRHPATYSEKLQWLKLNYRVAEHGKLVDKLEVKQIVADAIGASHVIPTLAVYDSVDDIDLDALPEQFVLKTTHDSGGVVIVKDAAVADLADIRARLRRSLGRNYFFDGREPHYLHVTPRIIAEPYLEDAASGQLPDYKFYCFNGEVKVVLVILDRGAGTPAVAYFDTEFSRLELRRSFPPTQREIQKPATFDEMLSIARTLSQGHPHVRVDLYEANGEVLFGELTFFPSGGFSPARPAKWERVWGDWLTLPEPVAPGP